MGSRRRREPASNGGAAPDDASNLSYQALQPDDILSAVESLGYRCDGRTLALNSYENRVYRVGIEEQPPLVAVEGRPRPAPSGHRGRPKVGAPVLDRAEVALDERPELPPGIAALAAEVREVHLVVLDPADREGQVHLEGPHVRGDLVRAFEVDAAEELEDLVPLRDVPLVEAVVRLDRGP